MHKHTQTNTCTHVHPYMHIHINHMNTYVLILTMYTVVDLLSMGFLYHQAETQNIFKFACNSMFLLLTNPPL